MTGQAFGDGPTVRKKGDPRRRKEKRCTDQKKSCRYRGAQPLSVNDAEEKELRWLDFRGGGDHDLQPPPTIGGEGTTLLHGTCKKGKGSLILEKTGTIYVVRRQHANALSTGVGKNLWELPSKAHDTSTISKVARGASVETGERND